MKTINTALPAASIQGYLGDIVDTKRVILWVSLTAVGAGFLFMIIQKYLAGLIVWVFIVLYFCFLIALTWGFFQKSRGKSVFDTSDFKKLKNQLFNAKKKAAGTTSFMEEGFGMEEMNFMEGDMDMMTAIQDE